MLLPTCEYAVASRAFGGERQSGDAALVLATAHGILIAVVDGLGHGDEAAAAAQVALAVLHENVGQPLADLFERCHARLQPTRGVALALVALDTAQATLSWAGVGNVEAVLIAHPSHAKQWLTNRSGVVGYRLPALEAKVLPIASGDLLIIATDGIDERFASEEMPPGDPDELAHAILKRYGKRGDDALVLVLRWSGGAAAGG